MTIKEYKKRMEGSKIFRYFTDSIPEIEEELAEAFGLDCSLLDPYPDDEDDERPTICFPDGSGFYIRVSIERDMGIKKRKRQNP